MAVGMGFIFWGMCSGGGGMCDEFPWPFAPEGMPGPPCACEDILVEATATEVSAMISNFEAKNEQEAAVQ